MLWRALILITRAYRAGLWPRLVGAASRQAPYPLLPRKRESKLIPLPLLSKSKQMLLFCEEDRGSGCVAGELASAARAERARSDDMSLKKRISNLFALRANSARLLCDQFDAFYHQHQAHGDDDHGAGFQDVLIVFPRECVAEEAEEEHAGAGSEAEEQHSDGSLSGGGG